MLTEEERLEPGILPLCLTARAVGSVLGVGEREREREGEREREKGSRIDYLRVIEFVEKVTEGIPDLLFPQHRARLLVGIKVKLILDLLVEGRSMTTIISQLDRHFPPNLDEQFVDKVNLCFRQLILRLLKDQQFRKHFLQKQIHEEYGAEFLTALRKLYWEFLHRLKQAVSDSQLQQFLVAAQTRTQNSDLSDQNLLQQYLRLLKSDSEQQEDLPPYSPPRLRSLVPVLHRQPPSSSRDAFRKVARRPGLRPRSPRQRVGDQSPSDPNRETERPGGSRERGSPELVSDSEDERERPTVSTNDRPGTSDLYLKTKYNTYIPTLKQYRTSSRRKSCV
ncbi:uncharacterized protein LOC103173837 [Callorhinchus milii]|uniref:uncharacterized protein LOC103173837 n=1 Tax=Callorhinchus milii TaxID=7868 RepID=UPI001C3FE930|nr:uncharacterized protein LOC103173837 [Callorhinchus milii]